jgi:hypothetical protein
MHPTPPARPAHGLVSSGVRKAPSWPRSWAKFGLQSLYSHRSAWANLHRLGQPTTCLAQAPVCAACACACTWISKAAVLCLHGGRGTFSEGWKPKTILGARATPGATWQRAIRSLSRARVIAITWDHAITRAREHV